MRKTRVYVQRELTRSNERILGIGFIRVNGNVYMRKRDLYMRKRGKRDAFMWKKRRMYVEKDVRVREETCTCANMKRDVCIRKTPTYV